MVAHATIIKKYAERRINKRMGDVDWTGSRVFSCGKTLYSYGTHFPLAHYLGEKGGKHVFLKNGDRYSSSTSGHQSETQHCCNGPTVSRTALAAAGVWFTSVKLEDVVAHQADMRKWLYRDTESGKYYEERAYDTGVYSKPFTPPRQGQFMPHPSQTDADVYTTGVWHVLGAVVIRKEENYFLCSLDEGQYFVAQLPAVPRSVDHAFNLLKPAAVRTAERKGVEVRRQGEWFFVSTGLSDRDMARKVGLTVTALRKAAKIAPLPERPSPEGQEGFRPRSRNQHICRQYFVVNEGIYAQGYVRHRDGRGQATGEHRTLKLGDEQWWRVYLNTEIASWTVGGRFD